LRCEQWEDGDRGNCHQPGIRRTQSIHHIPRADDGNRDDRERDADHARQPTTQMVDERRRCGHWHYSDNAPRPGPSSSRGRGRSWPRSTRSKRNAAICSEMSPIKKMMMLVRQRRTVELVMWTWVIIVTTP